MKTDQLITLLAADAGSRPAHPGARAILWLPGAVALMAAVFLGTFGPRAGLFETAILQATALKVGFGLLLVLAAGHAALRLVRPGADPMRHVPWLAGALVLVLAAMLIDRSWTALPAPRVTSIARCMLFIPLMALLPLAGWFYALRAGATTSPRLSGALAGLASGGLAILAYALNCTEDSPLFIGLWYSLGAIVAGCIGAWAGPRLLRW
jgi:hypothetical protein